MRGCYCTGTGLSSIFDGDTEYRWWIEGVDGGRAGEGLVMNRKGNGQSVGEASFLCVSQT
jgi:hypothetical protein